MPCVNYMDGTYTRDFNVGLLRDISLAIMAGRTNEEDRRKSILRLIPTGFDKLILWLDENPESNSAIIDALATSLASSLKDSDCVYDFNIEGTLPNFDALINTFSSAIPLKRLDSTLSLAQQVVEMDDDNIPIEEWAHLLSNDISKGND